MEEPLLTTPMTGLRAEEVISLLDLKPHPEGGFFRETFRDPLTVDGRAASTAIYYLLGVGDVSDWHRIDAVEVWHFYAGAPLELRISDEAGSTVSFVLGIDLGRGERPQAVVPANWWQTARSLGDWTLVGCTVAPGFEFSGFELARKDWSPGA
jgi:predicted cupin superfamily sugar epimerase